MAYQQGFDVSFTDSKELKRDQAELYVCGFAELAEPLDVVMRRGSLRRDRAGKQQAS